MVLGKLPVPGRSIVGKGPTALAAGAGGFFSTFFLSSIISLFSLPFSWRRSDKDCNTVSKDR